jgi:hypothetical protein
MPEVIAWYLKGLYTITIGKPLHYKDDANDRSLVKMIAENAMEQIRNLSH